MDTHYLNEVLRGNTEAFSHFIQTYQNKAFGIAMSIVKQEDNAKDVVQDSFIMAYSSLSKFRNDAKFSTWFYRIVVNRGLQFIKSKRRKDTVMEAFLVSDEEKSDYNTAIKQFHEEELKSLIKSVFEQIPSKEALILQLYYIDNQQILEIEEITGFTNANVKVLLHRGRSSFYKILKNKNIKRPY